VALIDQLVREADDRIVIMPGSGVRAANIVELAEKTGASEFHTSARVLHASAMTFVNAAMKESQDSVMADPDEILKIKEQLTALAGG
jgi:copper homeostasis protein